MSDAPEFGNGLLWGPLPDSTGGLPISVQAILGDLRPRFLAKGQAGRGCRAISRNGRVLLASDVPVTELSGRVARVRLQCWHKALLPGDRPEPFGILLCVRCSERWQSDPLYDGRLVEECEEPFALGLDVGGGTILQFRRVSTADPCVRGQETVRTATNT